MPKPPLDRRRVLGGGIAAALAAATALALPARGGRAQQAPQAAPSPPSGPFTLPPLSYAPDANEAAIDVRTMELHHDFHHRAYVNALNTALAQAPELASTPLEQLLARLDQVPERIRTAVRNNAGGHANHSMFWGVMGGRGGEPGGELMAAVERDLGGMRGLTNRFGQTAAGVFGSGWVFVTVTREGRLDIVPRLNQDTPLMEGGRVLLGNDVWEHAYYLRYQNRRPEYVANWWRVVDWPKVEARYAAAKAGTLTI